MADSKITALTALTGSGVATSDVFVLVDVSDTTMDATGTDKKMTADELAIALGTTLGLVGRDKIWDTKGDLAAATGADAASKLAVGADGTQLVADSSQTTGLKWSPRSRATSRTNTDTSAVNTTTETVVASQAIPTTVAAGDVVRLVAVGDLLNNTGGTVTYLPKAIIGATTVIASAAAGLSTSATRRQWVIQFEIVVNATNDERCRVESLVTGAGVSGWNISAGPVTTIGCAYGTAAEDLTAGKNAQISVTMGAASASADFVCHASWLEVIKA